MISLFILNFIIFHTSNVTEIRLRYLRNSMVLKAASWQFFGDYSVKKNNYLFPTKLLHIQPQKPRFSLLGCVRNEILAYLLLHYILLTSFYNATWNIKQHVTQYVLNISMLNACHVTSISCMLNSVSPVQLSSCKFYVNLWQSKMVDVHSRSGHKRIALWERV